MADSDSDGDDDDDDDDAVAAAAAPQATSHSTAFRRSPLARHACMPLHWPIGSPIRCSLHRTAPHRTACFMHPPSPTLRISGSSGMLCTLATMCVHYGALPHHFFSVPVASGRPLLASSTWIPSFPPASKSAALHLILCANHATAASPPFLLVPLFCEYAAAISVI
ncbi:hypothetical protein ACN47E_000294 [Coniothyrium glycines]